jgi:LacI family transcriptional regulator
LRSQGFKQALEQRGFVVENHQFLKIEDIDNCENIIEKFVVNNDFDALVAVNELFAVTASKALQKAGKKIPEDVAIVAFTDGMLSKYASPTLTTIGQKGEEMGGIAALKLIEKLESKDHENESYETVIVKTSFIERESTP